MKIAWIGTGVMGSAMAQHLKQAGHEVAVYNRSLEKAKPLAALGIEVNDTLAACVKGKDMVFTMVGYPKDVEEVYTSKEGIFATAKQGCICVDMTTSSPQLAKELHEKAKIRGIELLDAPVSGGDSGAKAASLSIMVGGKESVYQKAFPILQLMGNPSYMGEAGCGQHTKACNQIAVAGAVAAMSEAFVYAKANGLDVEKMLAAISGGAAGSWQIDHTAPRIVKEDFAPGFYIKHFIKDMHIVQAEMKDQQLEMLNTVCHMYETLADSGEGDLGTQALLHYYK